MRPMRLRQLGVPVALLGAVAIATVLAGAMRSSSDAHERSDAFWDALWVRAVEVEHYASWEEMALSADVIVVGTIEAARYGRARGSDYDGWVHYGHLTVAADEILAGAHTIPPGGIVLEVMLPSEKALKAIEEYESRERVVMFLRDKHTKAMQLGLPPDMVALEAGYYALVRQEAVVREIDGTVHARSPVGGLFTDWDARSFTDFTDSVRELLAPVSDS
jgi:hypothetical protein